jgi:hypothetical protein
MYFCYVDESGDCGLYTASEAEKTGSKYFILVGLILNVAKWKVSLDMLKSFRKKIAREGFLNYDVEFHCAEMIDPRSVKAFTSISIPQRWQLIDEYADTIGQNGAYTIISVVIDKSISALTPDQYLSSAVTMLYRAFDEFLKIDKVNGIVFFDRANERQINTHVRKLLGTGASGETIRDARIGWIIEDPIFRVSTDSIFIQSADVIVYTLKEKEFPQASRKKFNADKTFNRRLSNKTFKSQIAGSDGIIRI